MTLIWIDWLCIGVFLFAALLVGILVSRQAGQDSSEFFLSGRHMPWWLLGFSMVATTFSTDTPNLVADIVRKNGVAGNWVWWAFLLTGMLTVFLYAKLWRRSEVLTDVEFYEIRYSGKTAAILRGFRALYLGIFFNIMIMAAVSLAAIKIGGVMLGLSPLHSILWASIVTVFFSALGGLKGVLITDFMLFIMAMVGSVAAAFFALQHPDVGGLTGLVQNPMVQDKLSFFPQLVRAEDGSWTPDSVNLFLSVLLIPIAVQWWSVWYPGAEPGGGGYLAQRMLAAKDEKHATGAVLFFNIAHYGLRPWPWILVALASLIVYPNLDSIQAAFPDVDPSIVNDDLAYPAMLSFVPAGWLGLILASLMAAYMSTISTHLNWGSSYVVNDFYKRFVKPDATEKEMVRVGRLSTVLMMVVAALIALKLKNALEAFNILLQIGAGTGLLFILRWFWWRINAVSELTAMTVSFVLAVFFKWGPLELLPWQQLLAGVTLTTISWVAVTLLTSPTDEATLRSFCLKTNPGGPGWKAVYRKLEEDGQTPASDPVNLPRGILCMVIGSFAVYAFLFAIGLLLYGKGMSSLLLGAGSAVAFFLVFRMWNDPAEPEEGAA